MASNTSFDEMIQADRAKRKEKALDELQRSRKQALADEVFGRGRKSGSPGASSGFSKPPAGPSSLASRAGVMKRGPSFGQPNSGSRGGSDQQTDTGRRRPRLPEFSRSDSASRLDKGTRIYASLQRELSGDTQNSQLNLQSTRKGDLSIRGAAGPYVVVASNFAPGTTASDIRSVMEPVGGEMVDCRLLSSNPTVIAEMSFADKAGAENVVFTFNNRKADGKLLYVYMKEGGRSPARASAYQAPGRTSQPNRSHDLMDTAVDQYHGENSQFAQSDPDYDHDEESRQEPQIQDGRYGFRNSRDDRRSRGPPRGPQGGLRSDRMFSNNSNRFQQY